MADDFYGYDDEEDAPKGRDNLFLWTVFILLLISLLWEATLGVPYGWWNFQDDAMIGIRITAWSRLPIEEVCVWGRSPEKARAFKKRHASTVQARIRPVAQAQEAAACDVVCVVTAAREPVIQGGWVRPGTHVNLVGAHAPSAREADTALIKKSRLYVDSLASAFSESGDILIPIEEGAIERPHVIGEIGALLLGKIPGRQSAEDITVYKSLGVVAQDLIAAYAVYMKGREG